MKRTAWMVTASIGGALLTLFGIEAAEARQIGCQGITADARSATAPARLRELRAVSVERGCTEAVRLIDARLAPRRPAPPPPSRPSPPAPRPLPQDERAWNTARGINGWRGCAPLAAFIRDYPQSDRRDDAQARQLALGCDRSHWDEINDLTGPGSCGAVRRFITAYPGSRLRTEARRREQVICNAQPSPPTAPPPPPPPPPVAKRDIFVDQNGNGDTRTIAEAITMARQQPARRDGAPISIWVRPGIYAEALSLPENVALRGLPDQTTGQLPLITNNDPNRSTLYIGSGSPAVQHMRISQTNNGNAIQIGGTATPMLRNLTVWTSNASGGVATLGQSAIFAGNQTAPELESISIPQAFGSALFVEGNGNFENLIIGRTGQLLNPNNQGRSPAIVVQKASSASFEDIAILEPQGYAIFVSGTANPSFEDLRLLPAAGWHAFRVEENARPSASNTKLVAPDSNQRRAATNLYLSCVPSADCSKIGWADATNGDIFVSNTSELIRALADATPRTIWVRPGTYTGNFTMSNPHALRGLPNTTNGDLPVLTNTADNPTLTVTNAATSLSTLRVTNTVANTALQIAYAPQFRGAWGFSVATTGTNPSPNPAISVRGANSAVLSDFTVSRAAYQGVALHTNCQIHSAIVQFTSQATLGQSLHYAAVHAGAYNDGTIQGSSRGAAPTVTAVAMFDNSWAVSANSNATGTYTSLGIRGFGAFLGLEGTEMTVNGSRWIGDAGNEWARCATPASCARISAPVQ